MARVITFSRVFPSYHPKAGQQTYFVEKIWNGFRAGDFGLPKSLHPFADAYTKSVYPAGEDYLKSLHVQGIKSTTIRAGHRWKVGDWFSPRVWSGKPYNSKMITIAPDIQIKKVWDFEMCWGIHKRFGPYQEVRVNSVPMSVDEIAKNDGLEVGDFLSWFNKPMTGQIISWDRVLTFKQQRYENRN